jgi:hypothetical protein
MSKFKRYQERAQEGKGARGAIPGAHKFVDETHPPVGLYPLLDLSRNTASFSTAPRQYTFANHDHQTGSTKKSRKYHFYKYHYKTADGCVVHIESHESSREQCQMTTP